MSAVGTSAWRKEVWGNGCDESAIISANWILGAGKIQCHKNSIRVWRAVGRIMWRHRYVIRNGVTGCYNCRPITGGTAPSAHAQGVALDVNWDTNPYRLDKLVTDMPLQMVHEIQALKNTAGTSAVRWGGDWDGRPETKHSNYDAMHYEVICTPKDIRIGFPVPELDGDDQTTWSLLALNEKGPGVMQLQAMLNSMIDLELVEDGYFGPKTEAGVQAYQGSRGLKVDGVMGLGTWTALIHGQPEVLAGVPLPHKGQA